MDSVPVGLAGTVPDEQILHATLALDGDGSVIAQARHLAAGFPTRVQADHGPPVSRRALELTQLGPVSASDQSAGAARVLCRDLVDRRA